MCIRDRAVRLQKETGATLVHAFDDPAVIAGQGTIGLEILEQCPDIRSIVVPIGGGGLLAGIATAVKSVAPHVKVYGVQASGCLLYTSTGAVYKSSTAIEIELLSIERK